MGKQEQASLRRNHSGYVNREYLPLVYIYTRCVRGAAGKLKVVTH